MASSPVYLRLEDDEMVHIKRAMRTTQATVGTNTYDLFGRSLLYYWVSDSVLSSTLLCAYMYSCVSRDRIYHIL